MKDPNDSIGHILMQISKQRRTKSNAILNGTPLHSGQEVLLYYLNQEDGQTIMELVNKMAVKPATLSNMLDRMENAGLIKRVKEKTDRRVFRIYLTDAGREVFKKVEDAWVTIEEQTTKGLSIIEKFMLKRLLNQVQSNLS
jgi:DNA-binding MarR family transcriptional regulator